MLVNLSSVCGSLMFSYCDLLEKSWFPYYKHTVTLTKLYIKAQILLDRRLCYSTYLIGCVFVCMKTLTLVLNIFISLFQDQIIVRDYWRWLSTLFFEDSLVCIRALECAKFSCMYLAFCAISDTKGNTDFCSMLSVMTHLKIYMIMILCLYVCM